MIKFEAFKSVLLTLLYKISFLINLIFIRNIKKKKSVHNNHFSVCGCIGNLGYFVVLKKTGIKDCLYKYF